MIRRATRHRKMLVGGLGLMLIMIAITLGPIVAPYQPYAVDPDVSLAVPSRQHWLGTDQFGRDVFSRILHGGRLTVGTGALAVVLGATLGTLVGLATGLANRTIDLIVMRGIDILMAFPSILLALVVIAIWGPGLGNTMVAVGITLIPTYARVIRGAVLSIKEKPYVEASRAIGCGFVRMAFRHVLPNVLPSVLVISTVALGWAVLLSSMLSFLGLGPKPPTPEWGVDLANGRNYLHAAWWISTFPGLAIMLVVLSINLTGDGLRDLIDPRMRGSA